MQLCALNRLASRWMCTDMGKICLLHRMQMSTWASDVTIGAAVAAAPTSFRPVQMHPDTCAINAMQTRTASQYIWSVPDDTDGCGGGVGGRTAATVGSFVGGLDSTAA